MSPVLPTLLATLAAGAPALIALAHDPEPHPAMTMTSPSGEQTSVPESVTRGFAQVAGWIQQSAELVPAERYSWKPVDGVRTFGQLVAHLVDSYNYYCRLAKGPTEWADPVEKGVSGKSQLVKLLADAAGECRQAHASGQTDPLVENLGHTNLHYGNMVVYLRQMGIVPPSSR